jgi:hypothetical protein
MAKAQLAVLFGELGLGLTVSFNRPAIYGNSDGPQPGARQGSLRFGRLGRSLSLHRLGHAFATAQRLLQMRFKTDLKAPAAEAAAA